MVNMHEYSEVSDEIICALGAAAGEDAVLIAEPMSAHTTFKIGGPMWSLNRGPSKAWLVRLMCAPSPGFP